MAQRLKPRIAIPVPHSGDSGYSARTLPEYERAIAQAGGEPVRIPLGVPETEVMKLIAGCDGLLLPGSRADVDPEKYRAARDPRTSQADPLREETDRLLLKDAYERRKPVLGICYGLQSLNVYRHGTLTQHIESNINHADRAARHGVELERNSLLCRRILGPFLNPGIEVNTSHHQAAATPGQGLQVTARAADGVIEGLEGTSPEHFIQAVQWHPERLLEQPASQAIFQALVEAAKRQP